MAHLERAILRLGPHLENEAHDYRCKLLVLHKRSKLSFCRTSFEPHPSMNGFSGAIGFENIFEKFACVT